MSAFSELSPSTFGEIAANRRQIIADAPDHTPLATFPVNQLAAKLHPAVQNLKVASVSNAGPGAKRYRLVPNAEKGTYGCAYFNAGLYLTIFVEIDGKKVNRAYSIASSPKQSTEGFYEIVVKSVGGGLVSNYIVDNWKEGDEATASAPCGQFRYNRLRDAKTVIGIAGGSGITPFLSMAKSIADGDQNFDLVVLYGSRTEKDILCREELDALDKASDRIRVVHVLSDEKRDGYEYGFIGREIIEKYAPQDAPYSVFLCGPQAMYTYADAQLAQMNLERKYIRHELFGEVHDPSVYKDYPGSSQDTVKITVTRRDETRTVSGPICNTVLQILEQNGVAVPARCRSGECGFCHSRLASGKVYVPKETDGRRLADLKFGFIHPCATFPLTDLEIDVPADK